MGLEIERKFLVASFDWQALTPNRVMRFRQGYLAIGGGPEDLPETRVRLSEPLDGAASASPVAYLTVKGQGSRTRQEIEFEIPKAQAEDLLGMCAGRTLLKDRYVIPFGGLDWEVDVYRGPLEGLVVAEVELPSEDYDLVLPNWVGREVSDDKSFKNARLAISRWTGCGLAARQEQPASKPRGPGA